MRTLIAPFILAVMSSSALAQMSAVAPASQPALEAPVQRVAASNRDTQWRPTEAQEQRVVRDTYSYFLAKDERRFAEAYASLSIGQKRLVPYESWKTDQESFYLSAGAAEGRTVRKVTWYKDPVNAPPGIYVAVDFSSQFQNLALHCGFIAWQQQADGSFQLTREEENSIPKSLMSKLDPEKLQSIRAQFRC